MKTILVVEDDKPLSWLISKILSEKFRIVSFNNSVDAWYWMTEGNTPDMVITDINMAVIDGLEFLENIKSSSLFKHLPVAVLSGNPDPEKRKQSLKLGATAYIEKPFEPKSLLQQINDLLNTSNQESHVQRIA